MLFGAYLKSPEQSLLFTDFSMLLRLLKGDSVIRFASVNVWLKHEGSNRYCPSLVEAAV